MTEDDEHLLHELTEVGVAIIDAQLALTRAMVGYRESEQRALIAYKMGVATGLLLKATKRFQIAAPSPGAANQGASD